MSGWIQAAAVLLPEKNSDSSWMGGMGLAQRQFGRFEEKKNSLDPTGIRTPDRPSHRPGRLRIKTEKSKSRNGAFSEIELDNCKR